MDTLEKILEDCRTEAENTQDVISKMIADSKKQGVQWPELEEDSDHGICSDCDGTGCRECNYKGEF